ncbi:MAG: ATP-binding cassette domain-containing protein [Prevotella sp.]|nr:ATP-binding cassette domain-containing protein [Prevotella sp.]
MKVTAIVGRNGSGKTLYVEKMRRQMASDRVRYIAFRDSYGVATDQAYYLQLRWNQHDIDAETPTTGDLLERAFLLSGPDSAKRRQWQKHLYQLFDLQPLMNKYVITLSSGELRKFQLAKTLLTQPAILIMDAPFIGLDSETRSQLRQLLRLLAEEQRLEIYLVLSSLYDVPDYVTDIISIDDISTDDGPGLSTENRNLILDLPHNSREYHAEEVVKMNHVSIRYGERTILKDLDWTIMNGQHWVLSGQNGSGKSTLLSLICADNPQGYACDISLFGHQRGSGESIWEIKRHIGYVSPEMHRSYHRDLPALRIVASGLKDTIGLYVQPTPEEREQCLWWMRIFGIEHLVDRSFLRMSSGEQRLVLVTRAFVKDPALLILDEPLHGLDDYNRHLVKDVINTFCQRPNKTLIFVSHYKEEQPACIDHELILGNQMEKRLEIV